LINDSQKLISKLNTISDKVEDNIDIVKNTFESVKGIVEDVAQFERNLKEKIEPPVLNTINTYSAIIKAIRAFIEKFKSYHPKATEDKELFDAESGEYSDTDIEGEFKDINKELNEVRKKLEELKKV